jgi:hypothetical protein
MSQLQPDDIAVEGDGPIEVSYSEVAFIKS